MKHITKVITDIVKSFNSNGFTFDEYDTCPDLVHYVSVEGREISIQEDSHNQDWTVFLENVRKDDKKVSGPDLLNVLILVLGPVTDVPSKDVRNWETKHGVLITQDGNSVEVSQHYRKV